MSRVMILGLDGGTFDLIRPWAERGLLPNLAKLLGAGAFSPLRSTIPPMTFPAWNAFMTGTNPGKHGVFDFLEMKPGSYDLEVMNATHRKCETIWNIASRAGKRCAVLGVPVTYPPEPINGVMISGFDAPFVDARIMHPPELFDELQEQVGPYILSASFTPHLKRGRLDKALEAIYAAIDRKAATAKYILQREPWDVFMMVFGETDVAIHYFWKYHDPGSPQRTRRCQIKEGEDPIYGIYRRVDAHLGDLIEMAGEDTTIIVMSDHGAGGAGDKVIYLNRFLEMHGLLSFKGRLLRTSLHRRVDALKSTVRAILPEKAIKRLRFHPKSLGLKWEARLRFSSIDWSRTKVYSEETPYYPNLRINLQGREPDGIVSRDEVPELVNRVRSVLEAWTDPETGEKVVEKVYAKEEIYQGDHLEHAPDILIVWNLCKGYSYLSRPSFLSRRGVALGRLSAREIDRSDFMINRSGNHRDEGIFIIAGKEIQPGPVRGGTVHITCLAPTILHLLGLPIPRNMDGQVLLSCFQSAFAREPVYQDEEALSTPSSARSYTDAEAEKVGRTLAGLGYL